MPAHRHRIAGTWAFSIKPQAHSLWGKGEPIWEAPTLSLYRTAYRTAADDR
jgi:hypothetical protein